MSGTGRGRGRGRGQQKSGEMREPDKDAIEKILKESESTSTESTNNKSEDAPQPTEPKPEQFNDLSTTAGEGKIPPAAKELKDALQEGIKLKEEPTVSTVVALKENGKIKTLNPSVPPFVPSLNGPRDGFRMAPPYTKFAESGNSSGASNHSSSTSFSNSSPLNPDSKEFVPRGNVPDSAAPCGNGHASNAYGEADKELEQGWHEVGDILRGFQQAAAENVSSEILEAGAEILLKVYSYPGSFQEIGMKFQDVLSKNALSKDTITNLAEMFIHWGVKAPEVRYSSCRICQLIADFESDCGLQFKEVLMNRLQVWHKQVFYTLDTDEQKSLFVNFGGFFAEIYSKIEVEGQPIERIGPLIFDYVEKMLSFGDEGFIREACKILKLTGNNLMTVEDYNPKIEHIGNKLKELALDKSLSKTCLQLLMQVLELIGTKWGVAASPIKVTTTTGELPMVSSSTSGSKLNKDAAPFIPSESMSELYEFETVYNCQAAEQPVSRKEEWYEFVGDDDNDDYTDYEEAESRPEAEDADEAEYEGLDPDIELEMEAFIDEIEEHLMLQDFDPEMH